MGDDNGGDTGGTQTEATLVQSAGSGTISATAVTLTWDLPTDTDGYLGVTITTQNNTGTLLDTVDLDDSAIEYRATDLEPTTEYTFTITTRYTDMGKNNSTTVTATTTSATVVQRVVLDERATTSDSVTIIWDDPVDEENYTGVTISSATTVGDLDMNTPRMIASDINILTISSLTAETEYTLVLTFDTEYGGDTRDSSEHTITVTTQSNQVTTVTASDITENSITLSWTPPEDAGDDYQGVTISAMPTIPEVTVDQPTTTMAIDSLDAFTNYVFTITTRYSTANKSGGIRRTAMIRTLSASAIDLDGDTLVDIISLEGLNNVRYNLDLGATGDDGRYKESAQAAENVGLLCGGNADAKCTGYELMRSLDFNNSDSYESGSVNADWRPQDGSGMVLAQHNADTATNSGWDPIGTFSSRFEGNGHTISNLYGRRSSAGELGLFGATSANSLIRSVGITTARLYGSDADDNIGALVGDSRGTIIASYASGIVNGGAGLDDIGGLVGENNRGTIIASYASGIFNGGANTGTENVGGLAGRSLTGVIIASYASGTADGGADSDTAGGLIGTMSSGTIMASYASGNANGGVGNDFVGGLVGGFIMSANIIASYATATADGGTDTDTVGSIGWDFAAMFTATYGFGAISNTDTVASDGTTDRPEDIGAVGSGIAGVRMLTLDTAGPEWSDAAQSTLNAWDFGTNMQAPVLRYADYDGPDNDTYGCGDGSNATIVIPSVVATPTGPMTITCGSTLLPEQV